MLYKRLNDIKLKTTLTCFGSFRNICDPLSGSIELYVTKIRIGSLMFVMCLIGVWHYTFWTSGVCVQYEVCSKKDRTFAIKTLLLILQHFKHCPPQSSPLYWQYTVPNVSSIFGMPPGTHFLWWRAVLLSHFPESPLWFGNDVLSKWF